MPRCPNCFRDTMRTQDWACYLCGYPLASPAFKLIEKTYGEIRQERLNAKRQPVQVDEQIYEDFEQERDVIQEMQDVPLVNGIEINEKYEAANDYDTVPGEEISDDPVLTQDIPGYITVNEEAEEEVVEDKEEIIVEDENKPEEDIEEREDIETTEYQIESNETVAEVRECSETDDDKTIIDEDIDEDEAEAAPFVEEEPENIPVQPVDVEEEEPGNTFVQEEAVPVVPADIDITIDELLADYAADYVSATNKYVNKRLRLTGFAASIDVKEVLAINYIRLTDASLNAMKSVQCMFDKIYANDLRKLEKGQQITIQGKYTGSLIAMRMADCVLVNP